MNDAVLLGELLMRTGDYAGALDVLGRAEQIQPGARPELLMAHCLSDIRSSSIWQAVTSSWPSGMPRTTPMFSDRSRATIERSETIRQRIAALKLTPQLETRHYCRTRLYLPARWQSR